MTRVEHDINKDDKDWTYYKQRWQGLNMIYTKMTRVEHVINKDDKDWTYYKQI